MKEAFQNLKKQICSLNKPVNTANLKVESVVGNCVVVLMAGGESSRFKEVAGDKNVNKNSFKLPNGDSMIEMTIRMYRDAGFKDFVVLIYHQAESIMELLGDGSGLGVSVKYSRDPELPSGKGGAVKNAIENGSIPAGKYFIIHNPDDVIFDYSGCFPIDILTGHLAGERAGAIATVVVVEETPFAFTGMRITNNMVEQIEMYPMIPVPTHIGVSIFSPASADYFKKVFEYGKKADFEKVLFPMLSKEKKLYAVSIPHGSWLAINNAKAYKQLLDKLQII